METKTPDAPTIKIWHQNIDTNASKRCSVLEHVVPGAALDERMKGVLAGIKEHLPDVVSLQELRKCSNRFGEALDSVTPIVSGLKALGYLGRVVSYRGEDDKAFKYCVAVREDGPVAFADGDTRRVYMSLTPGAPTPDDLDPDARRTRNFGVDWERCFVSQRLAVQETGHTFALVSAHLPIVKSARDASLRLLLQTATQVDAKEPVVVVGDFNTIPDLGGADNVATMDAVSPVLARLPIKMDSAMGAFPGEHAAECQRTFVGMPNDLLLDDRYITSSDEWQEMEAATVALGPGEALDDGDVARFRDMMASKWLSVHRPEFLTTKLDYVLVSRAGVEVEGGCARAPEIAFATIESVRDEMDAAIRAGRLPTSYCSDHTPLAFSLRLTGAGRHEALDGLVVPGLESSKYDW